MLSPDKIFEIISFATGFVISFWGCSIALRGLKTWREQVIEAPKIELAREIMESFYNVRDFIKYLRRNLRSIDNKKIREYFEKNELNDSQCHYFNYLYEINQESEMLIKFQSLSNKAKVNFTEDLEPYFNNYIRIINDIKQNSHELGCYYKEKGGDGSLDKEDIKDYKKILYQRTNDKINLTLNKTIKEVETILKPIYGCKSIKIKNTEGLNDVK